MTRPEYLDVIRRSSASLADAASRVSLGTPVPSCPGWDMAQLVTHIAQVQWWVGMIVTQRATDRPSFRTVPDTPEAEGLLPWFRDATRTLLEVLESTDPDTPMWTFTAERRASFWVRRQAHEVAVHCWDAQHATGAPQPLPAALGADGVTELLEIAPMRDPARFVGKGESVHFHASDTDGEWLLRLTPGGLEVAREHAKADAAARGTASDLDLFAWGRVAVDSLEVFGDIKLLERVQRLTAL